MTEVYSNLVTSVDPRPMNNGGVRQSKIDKIIVHHNAATNKDIAINTWLAGGPAGTSAHYEITDNEIIGIVGENYVAYHAGGTGGSDIPKISNPNGRSIGLEHVNSSGAPAWGVSDKTLRNSAKLIADICKRYNLPIDRSTVMLHREVTSTACPGGLDIDKLIAYARQAANPIASVIGVKIIKGDKDMLLFKADKTTKFGDASMVFLEVAGKVIHVESSSTLNDLKGQGVPYTVMTVRNTEQLINALGGVK